MRLEDFPGWRAGAVTTSTALLVGAVLMSGAPSAVADVTPPEIDLATTITPADVADPSAADSAVAPRSAARAIEWFSDRRGSTAYEGYCERAVRLAWNRKTHHASALAHWQSSDGARHTTGTPPAGAFVFWNIGEYGHVGIADGHGGFWATNVNNRIGHANSLGYFTNYLGWKAGNSN